jgi:integrative and conjugative element protein (TIGR02256 family)
VGAGPRASRTRSSFLPDGAGRQHELERIYTGSGCHVTYLGDSHSHPHGSRRPSGRDCETARAVSRAPEARAAEPVTLIVCRGVRGWQAHAYRLREDELRPLRVKLYPPRGRRG